MLKKINILLSIEILSVKRFKVCQNKFLIKLVGRKFTSHYLIEKMIVAVDVTAGVEEGETICLEK